MIGMLRKKKVLSLKGAHRTPRAISVALGIYSTTSLVTIGRLILIQLPSLEEQLNLRYVPASRTTSVNQRKHFYSKQSTRKAS